MTMRIGLGRDLHRLVKGRPFILAGCRFSFPYGEEGHSDGDVLAHAVIDAILGAAALGDIGGFFPPDDPAWKDADSMELLRQSWAKVKAAGWKLENLDCCVSCEAPKISPYREMIRASLARALETGIDRVFVKAKTGEGLGIIGEGIAVEAEAVCLLAKENSS
jgi:2-C-methyl-D-erythritol 2,4-cyclodiphosphate synthase/2-C-methyl-D-erythritol 4-phosphate cytidylyltransferase/2-C-methyl-D-erythritol 2,4-cyclodiphosphate synthase